MNSAFEHEATAAFEIKGKGVRVQLWTLLPSSDELGGITIRDHKGRVLARVTEDGSGDRDPKKIRVIVDLAEAFTQKLPRATSYHHSGELFEALGPLIAALPKSKWEKSSRYTPPYEKAVRSEERKRKQRLRGIPDTLPPGEWRKFYERISAGASDARRDEVRRRWIEQDPAGWAEFLRDLSNNWAGWRNWGWEEPTPPARQAEFTGDAAEVLGLSGDFGPDEIRRAWRLKSKSAHPDAGGSNEAFRRITEARDVLLRAVGMH